MTHRFFLIVTGAFSLLLLVYFHLLLLEKHEITQFFLSYFFIAVQPDKHAGSLVLKMTISKEPWVKPNWMQ